MKKLTLLFFALLFAVPSHALLNFSGRGEGFCRSYSIFSSGFDAVEWNPANLAIAPRYSFNILTLGIEYSSNLGLADIQKIYTEGHFNDDEKEIFRNGISLSAYGGAQAVSFSWKNMAFTSYLQTVNTFEVPSELAELVFWGNKYEVNEGVYNVGGTKASSEVSLAVGLSGGQMMATDNFAAGATLKYFEGFFYTDANLDGELVTKFPASSPEDTSSTLMYGNGTGVLRRAEGGTGFGIDVGVLYFTQNYSMGISVVNLLSSMEWLENPRIDSVTFLLDTTDLEHFKVDTSLVWDTTGTVNTSFSTKQEPRIRIGLGIMKKRVNTSVELGYPQLIAVGAEFPFEYVSLRTGIGLVQPKSKVWIGLGVGTQIKLLHFDLGARMTSTTGFSFALSLTILPEEVVQKAFGQ